MPIELNVTAGDGSSRIETFSQTLLRVGRNPECEISFDDEGNELVSWDHAIISLARGPIVIDQNASNGTFVNAMRINGSHPIAIGDTIGLGRRGPTIQVISIAASAAQATGSTAAPSPFNSRSKVKFAGVALGGCAVVVAIAITMFATPIAKKTEPRPSATLQESPSTPPTPDTMVGEGAPVEVESEILRSDGNQGPSLDLKHSRTVLNEQSIRARYESTVVWAGMKIPDPKGPKPAEADPDAAKEEPPHFIIMPWCTGWISGKNSVSVPGDRAMDFKKVQQRNSIQTLVYQPNSESPMHLVDLIELHAKYDHNSPTSSQSLLHSAAVLSVSGLSAPDYDRAEVESLLGQRVFVLGYFGISDETAEPFSRLSAPHLSVRRATISAARPCSNCSDLVPLMRIELGNDASQVQRIVASDVADKPRYDGMLVVDRFGDVVGHLITLSDGLFVVSIANTLTE